VSLYALFWFGYRAPLGGASLLAIFLLLVGVLAFVGMALLLGAALVGIAAAGVLIIGGILSNLSRRQFRR
jgi:hypothetical protein